MFRQPMGAAGKEIGHAGVHFGDEVSHAGGAQRTILDDDPAVDHGEIDIGAAHGMHQIVVEVAVDSAE